LEKQEGVKKTVERLGKLEKEIEERIEEDNVPESKTTAFLYSPSKGLRAIYCVEKNSRSRIRGAGSGCSVFRRDTTLLFWPYYLWKFGGFLCLIFFVILLLCNPNKIL